MPGPDGETDRQQECGGEAPRWRRPAAPAAAVVYGAVPRNFDPPGFAGVMARLDDLTDLGVTDLWLSPITGTNPGSFGYDVTAYRDVRPDYGTKGDLRALVAAAHARSLGIVLDVVPNHTSDQHPHFRDAARRGAASPYWEWYDRDDAGQPTHYFDWEHLPNLNYGHPGVRRYMLGALSYWVREFDVDGFRLDAVWGIRQRHPEWLATFVAAIKRMKPDALLIAEASARDRFYVDVGFDAAYDWTDALGHWAWEGVFGGDRPIGAAMLETLTAGDPDEPDPARVLRFLNNNDTGPRFLTTHGIGCYRVALAMLLTLPGIPCLFTGDEVGAEYEPYRQPGPIDWSERFALRNVTKRLIALRRGTPALHAPNWSPLPATPEGSLLAYARTDTEKSQSVVLLNFSATEVEATVADPATVGVTLEVPLVDLWSGEPVPWHGGRELTVSIPGWGFRLLARGRG